VSKLIYNGVLLFEVGGVSLPNTLYDTATNEQATNKETAHIFTQLMCVTICDCHLLYTVKMPQKRTTKKKTRGGTINEDALAAAVAKVMQNPAFNVEWMPDMVEYYVHKQVVAAMLQAIEKIPPIELYGHEISVSISPIERA
jgi:hypothetical protein